MIVTKSIDAVIVVPGIMGSELVDHDGRKIWGLHPRELVSAYSGDLLDRLVVTEEDLSGQRGVVATRVLKYPAVLGWFRGSEQYDRLVSNVRSAVVDPRAVASFPYDWRLSVEHNGRLLARAALDHWEMWRALVRKENLGDYHMVSLTVVAHSMGGLVARAAQKGSSLADAPTQVLTLGTPFFGSVKALRLVADGLGAPLPGLSAAKLRVLAQSSPGVHDLIPQYRCVTSGTSTRLLLPADVATLGGTAEAVVEARSRWERLDWASGPDGIEWRSAVGTDQPTIQSVTIEDGNATYHRHLMGHDLAGDGTVYRGSAGPGWKGYSATAVPQTHAALVATAESYSFVRDKLLRRDDAPPLGTAGASILAPDIAAAGALITVRAARLVAGETSPTVERSDYLRVASENLTSGLRTNWQGGRVEEGGWLSVSHPGLPPGLHRVSVSGGSTSPVTELLWVGVDVEA